MSVFIPGLLQKKVLDPMKKQSNLVMSLAKLWSILECAKDAEFY